MVEWEAHFTRHLILATQQGRVVGFLSAGEVHERVMSTRGTYVVREYRRRGIAGCMWRLLARRTGVTRLHTFTVTKAGNRFASAMEGMMPCEVTHRTSNPAWRR
jgi:predicted GNAT family acetyltransferase